MSGAVDCWVGGWMHGWFDGWMDPVGGFLSDDCSMLPAGGQTQ